MPASQPLPQPARVLYAGAQGRARGRIDPDPATLVSPSDGIIGASGKVIAGECLQAKGFAYTLHGSAGRPRTWCASYQQGSYVTLRLTAGMYHRFHAPA